jgi:N-methylhydantoinase A
MGLRVAIDIGGGFVDLVALEEETGQTFWSKAEVTPENLSDCVQQVFRLSDVDPARVTQLLHGQTLVINTILQRHGASVGLITTKGFRDALALQRANRRDIFNLRYLKPEAFVPRERRIEITERTLADGSIAREVDAKELVEACQALLDVGVEALAVCFINSYRNPANELRARTLLQELRRSRDGRPFYVSISSDVSRQWREYERTSTCVLNSYVKPAVDRYLGRLTSDFRALGTRGTLYMMLSGGGVASFEYAAERPIETVESGPVAGVVGAVKLAELVGEANIIALDGGSTTTKASLLEGREVKFTTEYAVERDEHRPGYPITVPVVDIAEIGNGGASIAWLDELGELRVGPQSAGARPGPACYGWGGADATLTDAFLVIGFLNPKNFLGGAFPIHPDKAAAAMQPIARRFGISEQEAAAAIARVGDNNAAQLLRLVSIQRGFDPRDFTLIAYGGSGPLMAPFLAEELEIPKVLIPGIRPGNFSAWGLLMSDLRHTVVQTVVLRLDQESSIATLREACGRLEDEILATYRNEQVTGGVTIERTADLRYYGQEHTIPVPMPAGAVNAALVAELAGRFNEAHQREYGFALPGAVELVNLRVTGVSPVGKPAPQPRQSSTHDLKEAWAGDRVVYWSPHEQLSTPVYTRDRLPAQAEITGPAIIEESSTTIAVPPAFHASLDKWGNLILRRR